MILMSSTRDCLENISGVPVWAGRQQSLRVGISYDSLPIRFRRRSNISLSDISTSLSSKQANKGQASVYAKLNFITYMYTGSRTAFDKEKSIPVDSRGEIQFERYTTRTLNNTWAVIMADIKPSSESRPAQGCY